MAAWEIVLWQSMQVSPRICTCRAWFILTLPKVVPSELRSWQPLRVQAALLGTCTSLLMPSLTGMLR